MKTENRYEKLYNCLLDSEELHMLYIGLKGSWKEDKSKFIKQQQALEKIVNYIEVNE